MASRFSILVIEDTPAKVDVIQEKLRSRLSNLDLHIDVVASLVEALKRLEQTYYDFVILDILIPAVAFNPRAENSRTIIEQLASGQLITPACVVGLTAYEEEYRTESRYYAENLFSIERYKLDSEEWIDNIATKIRFVSKWKAAYSRAYSSNYDYDLVLMTARFDNEFRPIVQNIEWASGPNEEINLFRNKKLLTGTVRFGDRVLRVGAFCIGEMGMSAAAAAATQLVHQLRPRMLLMLGMCCGFRQEKCQSKSKLGDIIIARSAACWDEGRYGELEKESFFFNRALPLSVHDDLDSLISSLVETEMAAFQASMKRTWSERRSILLRKEFAEDTGEYPEPKYGLLLSGSSVVAHELKGDEIIDRFPNALGLEMETFAVYKAAALTVGVKPIVLSIKGVADFGNGSKHKKFQGLASRLSYDIGREIITRYFEKGLN
jgi:nucleoside phosphorylase/CheY-like chemotaxis protein